MNDAEDVYPALENKHPSICSLDELEEKYWNEIAPDMLAAGMDPNIERPTHEWLSKNGHRDLIYALSEYHDTTFAVFWTETLGLERQEDRYEWATDHEGTIEALGTYLDRRAGTKWQDSTVKTHRGRLNRYVEAYTATNKDAAGDLLTPVAPDGDVPDHEATDACWRAFEMLDAQYQRSTLEKIYRAVRQWYSHLENRGVADQNPTSAVAENFDWHADDGTDGPEVSLSPAQIRRLYRAASTNRERVLVIALCAWGLRAAEVARLHRDQLYLGAENPYIEFEERKNGPSTVNILYGDRDAKIRLSLLRDDDWNGYLFPSQRASSGHRSRNTIRNWFHDLAKRADVELAGGATPWPNPQNARQYWYDAYGEVLEDVVMEVVQEAAEAQGSDSATVVWQDYFTEERRRASRREMMRAQLAEAFEGVDE